MISPTQSSIMYDNVQLWWNTHTKLLLPLLAVHVYQWHFSCISNICHWTMGCNCSHLDSISDYNWIPAEIICVFHQPLALCKRLGAIHAMHTHHARWVTCWSSTIVFGPPSILGSSWSKLKASHWLHSVHGRVDVIRKEVSDNETEYVCAHAALVQLFLVTKPSMSQYSATQYKFRKGSLVMK